MTPAQFWDIEMQNQRNAMQMQQQANLAAQQQQREMVGDIGSAVGMFADIYQGRKDSKDMLAGMDTATQAMADLDIITPDFYEKYMKSDEAVRPFLFQALASPMFQSYNAGRSAAAQAQAWDQYKRKWGANAGGQPGAFTY